MHRVCNIGIATAFELVAGLVATAALARNEPAGRADKLARAPEMRTQVDLRFKEADVNQDGRRSRDEAKGKMPQVYQHFDQIEVNHAGTGTLGDIETVGANVLGTRPCTRVCPVCWSGSGAGHPDKSTLRRTALAAQRGIVKLAVLIDNCLEGAMAGSDELEKLGDLHSRGILSDDEFSRAKARVLDAPSAAQGQGQAPIVRAVNGLRRSQCDRWLGGVCGGIGVSTGVAAWLWRLVFAALVLCAGTGVVMYLLMWIFVPLENGRAAIGQAVG